jgi:hypothetical protein
LTAGPSFDARSDADEGELSVALAEDACCLSSLLEDDFGFDLADALALPVEFFVTAFGAAGERPCAVVESGGALQAGVR